MRVLAVTAGMGNQVGGPSYSIPSLLNALAGLGLEQALLTLKGSEEQSGFLDRERVLLVNVDRGRRGFWRYWTPDFPRTLDRLLRERGIELIHNHGVWLPANHSASRAAVRRSLPLIHSPRGMLTRQQVRYRALKKRIAWWLYQKRDLEAARVVHVTAQNEADDLRALGFKGAVAVIPNGVDLPSPLRPEPSGDGVRTALFLSRIHPKKGLPGLVEAWSRVRPKGWRMRIVGPDEGGHRSQVEALVRERGLAGEFSFEGPVYGEGRWEVYRSADLFILPTLSENFGISVAEALACGLPVITTQEAPWSDLRERSCGWWVPLGVGPLGEALREAAAAPPAVLSAMGQRGRALVEEKYSWASVALSMKSLYEWVLGGPPRPPFVQI